MGSIILSKPKLEKIIGGILLCISNNTLSKGMLDNSISKLFGNKDKIDIEKLLQPDVDINKAVSAIFRRIYLVALVLEAYGKSKSDELVKIDIKLVWVIIYETILDLSINKEIIASIGSQGFLAIPLYRFEEGSNLDILRLHIWDKSLSIYIDKEKTELFSIHCHQFDAQSWILYGEVYNARFDVIESLVKTDYNYFKIDWDKSNHDSTDNRKKSIAKNTAIPVIVRPQLREVYLPGDTYTISPGEFHQSRVNENKGISSTLFLFSSSKGSIEGSKVIGPSDIMESTINRKVDIDCLNLLNKLNSLINGRI
jgi:hypothetical protein